MLRRTENPSACHLPAFDLQAISTAVQLSRPAFGHLTNTTCYAVASGPHKRCNESEPKVLPGCFARSPNGSKSIRKSCALWDRKACSCARSSPLKAQKRRVLECPVLYQRGAPDTIRTCDLCLRRARVRTLPLLTRNSLELRGPKCKVKMARFEGNGHFLRFPPISGSCLPIAYPGSRFWPS